MVATIPSPPVESPAATKSAASPKYVPSVWDAPLMPLALAATAGIVADRYLFVPVLLSLVLAVAGLLAWLFARPRVRTYLPLVYLGLAVTSLGAAYHHLRREVYADDDIGNFADSDPRPARIRGTIVEEPIINYQVHGDVLQSFDRTDPTVGVLEVRQVRDASGWRDASGRARLIIGDHLHGLHAGDEVEVTGRLIAPSGPNNPGEFDYASHLRDQRIRALLIVRKTADGVRRVRERWPSSLTGCLGYLRAECQAVVEANIPARHAGVATALLLGDGGTMTFADWDRYIRTGVIHVLAISGQHLVILGAFLWFVLRVLGVRRRRGAVLIAVFLWAYALLTGGRPPAIRAAVTAAVYCGGIFLLRPTFAANSLALAWLIVAAINPTDLCVTGCLLSFLAVAILHWGVGPLWRSPPDPLQQVIDESRPTWWRVLRRVVKPIAVNYAITLGVWLAIAPLVAARYHLVSPIALLLGPIVVVFTTVALLAGFMMLSCAWIWAPAAAAFGALTTAGLAGSELIVDIGTRVPGGYWYVGDLPEWWLWGFYIGLLAALVVKRLGRRQGYAIAAGLGWLCLGLAIYGWRPPSDELRCTFLAVGHGGCAVLETPDGRVLLYDAGAMSGPDVTRRMVAPFLWNRGIRRIDEVFISHADLDHFNGLPDLLDRFAVGQVSLTPTFADKAIEGVNETLAALRRHQVPTRIIRAGDELSAGAVTLSVLHPSDDGPSGKENFRSMVLHVRYGTHSLLLTGDLEGPGLARVLTLPPPRSDVLMAPHHGSRAGDARELANRKSLASLAKPRVIVSCQGLPRGSPLRPNPYNAGNATFLGTWPHGAITVRTDGSSMTVETFRSGQRLAWTASGPG